MKIDVKLTGMDKVDEAVKRAYGCMNELLKAADEVNEALRAVGMEITQPPEGTDG